MKVMTVLGTRPEIIRLSQVIPVLDRHCEHILVDTGQNQDSLLSDIFYSGLDVRRPDISLGIIGQSPAQQIAKILTGVEELITRHRPDRMLILGDTNSGLAALIACRMGVPVFHLEAGNRCFDDRVPEEVNRRLIDHSSAVLMPYTERGRMNLLREGIEPARIFVVGNPIYEVLEVQRSAIDASDVHQRLGLQRGQYFVVTTHRQENVDLEPRLRSIVASIAAISRRFGAPVLWNVHPRTRSRLDAFAVDVPAEIIVSEPFGFHDFVALERHALCALTDSGTVQEECSILKIPNVTLRDVTERPETIEYGSNIVSGIAPPDVVRAVELALESPPTWQPPPEYLRANVSQAAARIILGHYRSMTGAPVTSVP